MAKTNSHSRAQWARKAMLLFLVLGVMCPAFQPVSAQSDDPGPPSETVRLIFVHHSCGENWLADDHGGLGRALGQNNYFVSDTNYGWGPDSIGDRTDITDWPAWFTGPDSARYLAALYAESEQNSWYTRDLPDPGGENQIIMFKSCFPNSNLEGSPNDPPARGDWLTVGNAKAIYNELLVYFSTRPDKLFIAITAPPVQDPTYAANARAFNTWLVTDWLKDYQGSNVAVFDFYNILTAPDNHHRFRDGAIEYITDQGGNTLYYPTDGDDHPSPAGNRKATEEFIPLLNVYYHRWQSGEPVGPPPTPRPTLAPPTGTPQPTLAPPAETPSPQPQPPQPELGGIIYDFESEAGEWDVFLGEGDTRLSCGRDKADSYSGTAGLRIEYDIAPDDWASCSLVYPSPQDWHQRFGLALYLRAEHVGQKVAIALYQGSSTDALAHFEFYVDTKQEAVDGWQRVDILWDQLAPPPWEGDATTRFDPSQTMGLAFLFSAPEGQRNSGQLWVDDISFLSALPAVPTPTAAPLPATIAPTPTLLPPPTPTSGPTVEALPAATATRKAGVGQPTQQPEKGGQKGFCPGSTVIGLMMLIGMVWARRPRLSTMQK